MFVSNAALLFSSFHPIYRMICAVLLQLPPLCSSDPGSHSGHTSLPPTCLKIDDDHYALVYAGDVARPFGGVLPARCDGLPKGARDEVSPPLSFPAYALRARAFWGMLLVFSVLVGDTIVFFVFFRVGSV